MRFRSRQSPAFAGKVLNAMRAGFGGHSIKPASESDK
jgi:6-phosphogluconate dehydrogenase